MPPRVSSLNTTPKPKVSCAALRSQTRMSASGSSALASAAKYNPPGPPPITAMRIQQSFPMATALARWLAVAQPEPLKLAGGRPGQCRYELDGSWVLVRGDLLLGEGLQLGDLGRISRHALAQHHRGVHD